MYFIAECQMPNAEFCGMGLQPMSRRIETPAAFGLKNRASLPIFSMLREHQSVAVQSPRK